MLLWLWAWERVHCVKAGLISGQPHSPPPSATINLSMGAIHACWCVSECKFESGSCALSWTSPALAGQKPGTDWQKFHGDITEAVRERSVWLITLIKQHSIVVRITLLNNAGVIPGNRPVESWITPVLIVLPSSLAGVALRRVLRGENRKPGSSLFPLVEFGVAAHVQLLKPVCQKHTLTNCLNSSKLSFKSLKCTAGGQRLAVDVCVVCEWFQSLMHKYGHTEAKAEHGVRVDHSHKYVCVCIHTHVCQGRPLHLLDQNALLVGISWVCSGVKFLFMNMYYFSWTLSVKI